MSPVLPPPLLALTPGDLEATSRCDGVLVTVARAVGAGLRGVLLREPELPDRPFLELARGLARILAPVDGWLGLHDRAHLVAASGAQGLHLGFRSLRPEDARAVTGPAVALGLSTHLGDDPSSWSSVDYRFFGPVKDTPSKRGLKPPSGIGALGETARAGLPVWAIGGLALADMLDVHAAGAAGCAALRGILGAGDPCAATRAFLEASPWTRAS